MATLSYALQLYTVRDALAASVAETLRAVKAAGYDYVELAGTHGLSDDAFAAGLRDAGLTAMSSHQPIDVITQDPERAANHAKAFAVSYVVAPYVDPASMPTAEAWAALGKELNRAGALLAKRDVRLCYHNHDHELVQFDNRYALDILLNGAAPANLAAEFDTYWLQAGGADPADTIRRYSGRCPILHVKDRDPNGGFAPVGSGVLDWPGIFRAARDAGVQWYVVEQDETGGDPIEAIAQSARFLQSR